MDETEWLRSADARQLLDYIFPQTGFDSTPDQPRKLRLYLAALCRVEWGKLPPICQGTTLFAERIADGEILESASRATAYDIAEHMTRAHRKEEIITACCDRLRALGVEVPPDPKRRYSAKEWLGLTWMALMPLSPERPQYQLILAAYHRADLVRCVFGNPFQPPPRYDARLQTDDIHRLATTIYRDRQFAWLPVLADMLEEAGCDDAPLLHHCREEHAPHARGCWALDAILRGALQA